VAGLEQGRDIVPASSLLSSSFDKRALQLEGLDSMISITTQQGEICLSASPRLPGFGAVNAMILSQSRTQALISNLSEH